MLLYTVGGAVIGGVAGYRLTRGTGGAVVGAVVGGAGLPRLADYVFGGAYRLATKAEAIVDVDTGGLHVGAAVVRPSVAEAIAMLRPTLALYGTAELASAALANAYAESRFDRLAGGDVDASGTPLAVGLFQLHANGAGKGMTLADRVDPMTATRRILEVAAEAGLPGAAPDKAGGLLWGLFADVLPGEDTALQVVDAASLAALTARFTNDVEKPANAGLRAAERVASLRTDNYLRQVLQGLKLPVI